MSTTKAASPLLEARRIVSDLFAYRPMVYWTDMLLAVAIGHGALIGAIALPGFDVRHAGLLLVSAFALLRAALFIHELSHFRRGVMPGFTAAWNLLVGIPLLLPSFMYVGTHTDHHKRVLYGTIKDPEYYPLAHLSRRRVLLFVLETLVVPALLVLRYGVLSPLGWLVPPLRRFTASRLSALVINPSYARPAPTGRALVSWLTLETLIFAWIATIALLIANGTLTWRVVFCWYAVAASVALINQVRTLAAHHYENDGRELTTTEQLLDSVNVRGVPLLTEMVFPVGLKYHALHHFLPDMPYHALPRAHARLMEALPADSDYARTEYPGLMTVVGQLWRRAAKGGGLPERWSRGS